MADKEKSNFLKAASLLLAVLCLLSGCGFSGAAKEQETVLKQENKPYIAVITKSTGSNFFKSLFAGASTASIEYNVNVTLEGPENEEDYETQNRLLEQAIKNKAKAIVLSAIDYNKSVEIVERAVDAGIYVVAVDSSINTDKISAYIGTDNYEAGREAGEALLKTPGNLNLGLVNFDVNSYNGQERERGVMDVVAENPRLRVAADINVASNIPDTESGTAAMLTGHREINAIVTFNEWTTLGVGYAVSELGLKDQTTVVGFDNNVISVGMLETGEMDALIVQNPYAMGYLGVETAWNLISGKEVPKKKIRTETMTATRENMFDTASQKLMFPFR